MQALRETWLGAGAQLDADGRPLHFGEPAAEFEAATGACVLIDRGHHGRLFGDGPDLLDLLNRLSTKAVNELQPLDGRETVLTTNKGRIVARLWVHRLDDGVLLICGPGQAEAVLAHLDRFTFAEQTGLAPAPAEQTLLALSGPSSREAAEGAGLPLPEPRGTERLERDGQALWVLGHDGIDANGVSVLVPLALADRMWLELAHAAAAAGGMPAGDLAAERARIAAGLPAPGHELSEEHNPLEAGLWEAVDFDKGCYVGQEVVARLRTYDKVTNVLRGWRWPAESAANSPAPGDRLHAGARRVGRVTSAVGLPEGGTIGLAFVKRDHADADEPLTLREADGPELRVESLPLAL